jgi:hypothetical protein
MVAASTGTSAALAAAQQAAVSATTGTAAAFVAINSTGAALSVETARAIARENAIDVNVSTMSKAAQDAGIVAATTGTAAALSYASSVSSAVSAIALSTPAVASFAGAASGADFKAQSVTATTGTIIGSVGNVFSVGGSTLAVVDGKVGIGTDSPSSKVHVSSGPILTVVAGSGLYQIVPGLSDTPGAELFQKWYHTNGTGIAGMRVANSNGFLNIDGNIGGTSWVSMMSFDVVNNRIGIGVTAPTAELDVNGRIQLFGADPTLNLGISNYYRMVVSFDAGNFGYLQTVGGGPIALQNSGGSVGIGTSVPGATLDVNGAFQFGSGATKSTGTATGGIQMAANACQTIAFTNGTNATLSSGTIVQAHPQFDLYITTAAANSIELFGMVQDAAGCASGAVCQVGFAGVCLMKLKGGEACDHATSDWAGTSDTEGYGQCDDDPVAHTLHNQETGHYVKALDSGMVYIMTHQN